MNEDQLPERERPFPHAIMDVLKQKDNTPELNKELGIIAKVDPINPALIHHMDHGKSHPIIVVDAGSDGKGLDHEAILEYAKKSTKKIGIIGHAPIFPSALTNRVSVIDDSFEKKLDKDLKKEINLLNDLLPIPQECNNRAARRKKNKFKNKKK